MPERDVLIGIAESRAGAVNPSAPPGPGRVVQVSISAGGVPKLPVAEVRVNRLGLEGDGHNDTDGHGGPMRAVSLLAVEAIRRVAADGNPIAPGTAGENLTTQGIELGALPYGSRLAIGPELVLELTSAVSPCRTIAGNFSDGRFARLSAKLHPLDTRVYARVVRQGTVRLGDVVTVLPDDTDT